jgi:serine/threonine protein kinase
VPFVVGENVGPYRITERLGTGGMATVWKAYHAALDRYVALKVLHASFKEDPQFAARFQREAKIVAKLIHPHIVPVYDFSEHEGMSYLVMRYIDGHTLKAILKEGPLPLKEVLEMLRPAGEALTYAHEQGVLHRDIKPSNFLIDLEGEVFLTDFGLARMAESTDSTMSRDMMIGTPQYISPEQARGRALDEGTDIYSLGVVLFEMLTGKTPYDADTPYAVIHDHIFSPLPLPSEFKTDIPELV